MASYDETPIGNLRWSVKVVQRLQRPDGFTGIDQTDSTAFLVRADVQPIGAITFYNNQALDVPITHRIRVRWLDYIGQGWFVIRETMRPDGSTRTEEFRIRRVKEIGGRKRFMELECELMESI